MLAKHSTTELPHQHPVLMICNSQQLYLATENPGDTLQGTSYLVPKHRGTEIIAGAAS